MSFESFYRATAGIGDAYSKGLDEFTQRSALAKLGTQLQSGDYNGAAQTAFSVGDAGTGIGLMKLGETYRQSRLEEENAAKVLNGGGSLSGIGGASGNGLAPLGAPSRAMPAFTSTSGDMGDYLASTRAKESGGNDLARNPSSTATGRYQFTEGTWNGLARKYPNLGLTPNGRTDPAQQERAMQAFTRDNAQALTAAGIPINPQTLYGAHFLGASGFTSFARGAANNPGAPAINFVGSDAARANRTVFFDRDGSPKTAGEVFAWMGRGRGGGGAPAGRPPVAVAENEADVQALEGRMGTAPQAPRQVAGYDARSDLPAEGAFPAGYNIPEGQGAVGEEPIAGARGIVPGSPSSILNGSAAARSAPAMGGPPEGRSMTLPPEAGGPPVQVAQADGGVPAVSSVLPAPAGGDMGLSARLRGMNANDRVDYLTRLSGVRLPERMQGLVKSQLDAALQEARDPEGVREFMWARRNGMTQARNPAEYAQEKAGDRTQFIQSNGRVLFGDRKGGTVRDVTPEGLPPTWRPLTAEERQGLGVRPDAAVYMTPEGPKSLSGQTINVAPGERAQDAAIGADYGKRFVELQRGATSARSTLSTIDTMERAMNAPGFYSGTGGQGRLAFNRALTSLGITDKETAAPAEVFDALANRLVMESLGGSLGAGVSNADVSFLQRTTPDLAKTPAGNRQLLSIARAVATRQQEVARLARDYAKANNNRLDPGFDDAVAQWAEANPLFPQGGGAGGSRSQVPALPSPTQARSAQPQPEAPSSAVPAGAVDYLRANPNLRDAFDAKYGTGAAARALGGN
ncbi:hypothetical protein [Methylorubrum aminovorans]